jgi:phosphoglucosamine mutase
MADESLMGTRPTGPGVGRATRCSTLADATSSSRRDVPSELSLDGVKIVVDAAHGAAYRVAPLVFTELGAQVTCLGIKPNGININEDSGAMHPGNACAEVVKNHAHMGVALDGDADRVIVIDERGQIVDGDVLMAMCAARMMKDGELRKKTVVATVMSNLGLERAVERLGGKARTYGGR